MTDFPLLGLKLSAVRDFLDENGGDLLYGISTKMICETFIKPSTEQSKLSYCEMLLQENPSSVGPPNVFVSHAWSYEFLTVINILLDYFIGQEETILIWFDIFSNNQHKSDERSFEWWTTTFQDAIRTIHHTVLILSPWNDPIPMKRAWCLWEIFSSIQTNTSLTMIMDQQEEDNFLREMALKGMKALDSMLMQIDCEKSECYEKKDQIRIHEAVLQSGGFMKVNSTIFAKYREWVLKIAQRAVDNPLRLLDHSDEGETESDVSDQDGLDENEIEINIELDLTREEKRNDESSENSPIDQEEQIERMAILANVLESQGNFEDALALKQNIYDFYKSNLGETHFHTLIVLNNLALCHRYNGHYNIAEQQFLNAVNQLKAFYPDEIKDILSFSSNLAETYLDQQKYELAETLFQEVLAKRIKLFGPTDYETLRSMNGLAATYQANEKFEQAEAMFQDIISIMKREASSYPSLRHPFFLLVLSNLATLYQSQQRYQEALNLYHEEKIIEKNEEFYGQENPKYLISLSNLAILYEQLGRLEEAESLFLSIIEKEKKILGANHNQTLQTMLSFASFYEKRGMFSEGIALYNEIIDLESPSANVSPLSFLNTMSEIALVSKANKNYEYAEHLLWKIFSERANLLGKDHSDTLETVNCLLTIAEETTRKDEILLKLSL